MTLVATLSLQAAAERVWDAVVVGAGPAGAMAARELARRSVAVLLVDRASFPRWKVCGCCLNGHALATLREVGLASSLVRLGAVPLRSIQLATVERMASVSLSGSVALSREAFDTELVSAAMQSGAHFLPQTMASLFADSARDGGRYLELQQGPFRCGVMARVVLCADGLGGTSLAHTEVRAKTVMPQARIGAGVVLETAPAFFAPGVIFMACGRHGYLGAVRLEDERLNLAAAFDPGWVRTCGGLGLAATTLLAEVGWPEVPNLEQERWRGTPTLTRRARRRAGERLFLLGDASGYIEPFTGEGMAWALAAGKLVAPLAARAARRWQPDLARQWETIYEGSLGRRQRVCRAVAVVLRSSWLTGAIIRLLTQAPALAMPLTRYFGCGKNPKADCQNPKEFANLQLRTQTGL
jgi:menaquinone-9 beta-reductase